MTQNFGKVTKGWGSEEIWASTDTYCGKLMHFNPGAKFSMHFHAHKDETWYVLKGKFVVEYINTENAFMRSRALGEGDVWRNKPLEPHRLICISPEGGTIIEVSTKDTVEDNYRVLPGDSQGANSAGSWPPVIVDPGL